MWVVGLLLRFSGSLMNEITIDYARIEAVAESRHTSVRNPQLDISLEGEDGDELSFHHRNIQHTYIGFTYTGNMQHGSD